MNAADRDVVKFLKLFTFLSRERIEEFGTRSAGETREARGAARTGRRGDDVYPRSSRKSPRRAYFRSAVYGNLQDLNEQEIAEGFSDVPSYALNGADEVGLIDLLVDAQISSSRRQAREDIRTGGHLYQWTTQHRYRSDIRAF